LQVIKSLKGRIGVFLLALGCLPADAVAQQATSVPLGSGRPETPGITRTQLRDDPKSAVVRVVFEPGAKEPPHTHPYDVVLIPITANDVEFTLSGQTVKSFSPGVIQFVPRDAVHALVNLSKTQRLELITVAIK
jgi:quercetin dioxygenase-like cupin family protein